MYVVILISFIAFFRHLLEDLQRVLYYFPVLPCSNVKNFLTFKKPNLRGLSTLCHFSSSLSLYSSLFFFWKYLHECENGSQGYFTSECPSHTYLYLFQNVREFSSHYGVVPFFSLRCFTHSYILMQPEKSGGAVSPLLYRKQNQNVQITI